MPIGIYDRSHLIRSIIDRILKKVVKDEKTKCWYFIGSKSIKGYGRINYHGNETILSHRYVYWYYKKSKEVTWEDFNKRGLLVCHSCDNRICNNPDHLWEGTVKDNSDDMINKGRSVHPKGEETYSHKLTERQVLEIFNKPGKITHIARLFNVGFTTVQYIKLGKSWSWLTNSVSRGF